jgi:YggT family protein
MLHEERWTTRSRGADPETGQPDAGSADRAVEHEVTTVRPSAISMLDRIVTFLFGLVQLVIGLRIVLLLLDARQSNDLVRGIIDVSQLFVAPFEGILRTNALSANGSVLDIAAIVAVVGWTIVELVVLQIIRVGRVGGTV